MSAKPRSSSIFGAVPAHALWVGAVCALALVGVPARRPGAPAGSASSSLSKSELIASAPSPRPEFIAEPVVEGAAPDPLAAALARHEVEPRTAPALIVPGPAPTRSEPFSEIGRLELPGAEIAAWDRATSRLLITSADGRIAWARLLSDGTLALDYTIHIGAMAGLGADADVTHVAIDPAGRGFAAASVVPKDFAARTGRVVFFDVEQARALAVLEVGHNPDAVKFTDDGALLVVANEGQPARAESGTLLDPPGSLSVIDLAAVTDMASFDRARVETIFFSGPAMEDVAGVRIHPRNARTPGLDLEPESIALVGTLAYVALQENSAVAVFDLASRTLERIVPLPAAPQFIDASDKDGGALTDDEVLCWPMPDHLGVVHVRGATLLITANEGDRRAELGEDDDLADHARLSALSSAGRLGKGVDPALLAPDRLGRLRVCLFSGDDDGDGRIDRPVALGSRALSVWDADTFQRLGDTGSQVERTVAAKLRRRFNSDSDDPEGIDARSDDSGAEPEGLALGWVRSTPYAFIGLERPGIIGAVDLSQPTRPTIRALFDAAGAGATAPEGLIFIGADESPTGRPVLIVAFEGSGVVLALDVGL